MPEIEFSIDWSEIAQFAKTLVGADVIFASEIKATMQAGVDTLVQAIVGETPVGVSGNLRSGIAGEITGEPLGTLTGEVMTDQIYGEPVEFGRKPGKWPPRDAIKLWVIRKLGISEAEGADQVAFLIARKIGKSGTQGAHMFQVGFDNAEPAITAYFEKLPQRVIDRIAAAGAPA